MLENILTEEHIRGTYQRKCDADKAIAFLRSKGVFPLNLSNSMLKYITRLGLHSYLSGRLWINIRESGKKIYGGAISREGYSTIPDFLVELEDNLEIKFRKEEDKDGSLDESEFLFRKNGSFYARALSELKFNTLINNGSKSVDGVRIVNNKSRDGSKFPDYLINIIENYDMSDEATKPYAKTILNELVTVVFNTKFSVSDNYTQRIYLLEQPTVDQVITQGSQIRNAIKLLFPDTNPGEVNPRRSLNNYAGFIPISVKDARLIQNQIDMYNSRKLVH